MIETAEIRPKLKQSTIFLQTDEGVFFQGDETSFRLKGKSIGRWISALSPYMTGDYTLTDLSERLEPAHRATMMRLVDVLLEKGVLKNAVLEAANVVGERVRQRFRTQIAFLDHYVERPAASFKAFRESRILLRGNGEALSSLALCLLRNGLQELLLAPDDEAELSCNDWNQRWKRCAAPDAKRISRSIESRFQDTGCICRLRSDRVLCR